jgi:hypothetical protein
LVVVFLVVLAVFVVVVFWCLFFPFVVVLGGGVVSSVFFLFVAVFERFGMVFAGVFAEMSLSVSAGFCRLFLVLLLLCFFPYSFMF